MKTPHGVRTAAARLRASPGALRLTGVRFASQFGDGMFQSALGGAILFSPERESDPVAIAAGFAVLLLPYSVLGPFAGALLDRWDRRAVLMWANLLRGLLIGLAAVQLALGGGNTALLITALAAVGVSRFVLAGLSASLPHVVRDAWLVPTNSVLATVGSAVSAAGAAAAVGVIALLGAGATGSGIATATAAVASIIGAVTAAGFTRGALGPADRPRTAGVVPTVAAGLAAGVTAVWRSPSVTAVLLAIGAHRVAFGIDTLVMVLLLRANTGSSLVPGGFAGFGVAISATAAGMLLAAVATPLLLPRIGRATTVTAALLAAAVVQAAVVATLQPDLVIAGAFLLGFAGQTVKLTGDAALQIDIDDTHRGRVFAVQDTVFNAAFVGAVALAAVVVRDHASDPAASSAAPAMVHLGSAVYFAAAIVGVLVSRRRVPPVETHF